MKSLLLSLVVIFIGCKADYSGKPIVWLNDSTILVCTVPVNHCDTFVKPWPIKYDTINGVEYLVERDGSKRRVYHSGEEIKY